MRFAARALPSRGVAAERIYLSLERNMRCAVTPLRPLPVGPIVRLPRGARLPARGVEPWLAIREL